jgi:hypothetical protein
MDSKCNWCGKNFENYVFSLGYCSNKCKQEKKANTEPFSLQKLFKFIKILLIIIGLLGFCIGWYLIYLNEYLIGIVLIVIGSTLGQIGKMGISKWIKENW